jgi:hypothetical protein
MVVVVGVGSIVVGGVHHGGNGTHNKIKREAREKECNFV